MNTQNRTLCSFNLCYVGVGFWLFLYTGSWACHNGTAEVEYRNWNTATGQPDNKDANEHCVQIKFMSGKWNDAACDRKKRAICESAPSLYYSCTTQNLQ